MSGEEFDLDKNLTFVTNKVVKRLIEWRKRREKWKKIKFIFDMVSLILMVAITFNIYLKLGQVNDFNQFYSTLFSPGVENAIMILIPTLIVWKYSNWKYREVDDDYEVLRKEIIDRADELWFRFPEDWSHRQEVLKQIDRKYGVNLFYKKK